MEKPYEWPIFLRAVKALVRVIYLIVPDKATQCDLASGNTPVLQLERFNALNPGIYVFTYYFNILPFNIIEHGVFCCGHERHVSKTVARHFERSEAHSKKLRGNDIIEASVQSIPLGAFSTGPG